MTSNLRIAGRFSLVLSLFLAGQCAAQPPVAKKGAGEAKTPYPKRIAALPGQEIPEEQPVLLVRPSHRRPGDWVTAVVSTAPGRVPKGQLYVLGDNAPVSDDSRSFGTVPIAALLGRVLRWNEPGRPPDDDQRAATRLQ